MYTIISMYTEILFWDIILHTHICWMENKPDGHLLNGYRF